MIPVENPRKNMLAALTNYLAESMMPQKFENRNIYRAINHKKLNLRIVNADLSQVRIHSVAVHIAAHNVLLIVCLMNETGCVHCSVTRKEVLGKQSAKHQCQELITVRIQ